MRRGGVHLFNGQDALRHSAPSSADHCLLTSAAPDSSGPRRPAREAEGDARRSFKGAYMCTYMCLETRGLKKAA